MGQQRVASRLAAVLWLIAALLAWTALAVRYARGEGFRWSLAAAGLFFVAFAVDGWRRWRAAQVTPRP